MCADPLRDVCQEVDAAAATNDDALKASDRRHERCGRRRGARGVEEPHGWSVEEGSYGRTGANVTGMDPSTLDDLGVVAMNRIQAGAGGSLDPIVRHFPGPGFFA